MTPAEILGRVLYKDQDVIVLDKPAGLAVHAGPNSPDHLELYLDALRFGWAEPPRLAHRLDRDTSGCLILGRHDKALKRLGKLFVAHRIEKRYWSVCLGSPPGERGTVDAPILKVSARGQGWRIRIDPAGQQSITDWSVMGRCDDLTWIEWRPRTGRTHQIRVHAKHLGCPLLGDAYYGPDPETAARLHLLARAVSVPPLAPSKPPIQVTAPPPEHMKEALVACGWRENDTYSM
jgi:RluA family pseudouridine synthase